MDYLTNKESTMSWNDNFYYNAEKNGITLVTEVSWDDEPYTFDLTAIWEKDGQFYMASDSGCSCPTPFERIESLAECDGPFDRVGVMMALMDLGKEQLNGYYFRDKDEIGRSLESALGDLLDYEPNN